MYYLGKLSFKKDNDVFINKVECDFIENNLYKLFDSNSDIQNEILTYCTSIRNECVNINYEFELIKDFTIEIIHNHIDYNYNYYCSLNHYFYMLGYLDQLYFYDMVDEYYTTMVDIILNHKELFYNENEMRYYYNYVLNHKNDYNGIFKMMEYLRNVIWIYSKYKSDFKKKLEIEKQEYF